MLKVEADRTNRSAYIAYAQLFNYLEDGEAYPLTNGQDPSKKDLIFFPINPGTRWHWYLCVFNRDEEKIQIYDSGTVNFKCKKSYYFV